MLKVAILGTVPYTKRMAPYHDPSWDIWVCSPGNSQAGAPQRITKWFELHAMSDMLGAENASWCPQYFEWLSKLDCPVYMQELNDHVPNAIQFPRKPLLDKWGESGKECRTNWFTSSIAWMMAYAIHLGASEIGIWGVDMAATEEHYSWQKAGCLRFVEIARQLGIRVVIPIESTLATPAPVYGYAEATALGRSMIVKSFECKEKIGALQAQIKNAELQVAFFQGAYEQMEFMRRTYVSGLADAEIDEGNAEIPSAIPYLTERAAAHAIASGHSSAFEETASGLLVPTEDPAKLAAPPTAAQFADNPDAAALLGNAHQRPPKARSKRNGAVEAKT